MSIAGTPKTLTVKQLEYRIDFHQSTAALFEKHGWPKQAEGFRQLANDYRDELEKRTSAAELERLYPKVRPITQEDIDAELEKRNQRLHEELEALGIS